MRWPTFGPRDDDPRLAATTSLLEEFAAGHTLGAEQRRRIRTMTLAAFDAQRAAGAGPRPQRSLPRGAAFVLAIAAILALTATVAAAQSGPGEPFYGVRLTIESLTLPAGGHARSAALLAQLDRRIAEAREQSARGNANGVSDAVRAYTATLDEIDAGIGQGASDAAVDAALEQHIGVLDTLLGSAPAPAQAGLHRALDRAQQALEHGRTAPGSSGRQSHPQPAASPPGRR